ncbi:hypothetical protein KAR91_32225 [Candidatus Pacearchaeota archaeon]|nr:hypothetical protein [Candidatus Pacearchaeota archaeon]
MNDESNDQGAENTPEPKQPPTVGRIVHFFETDDAKGERPKAAVVTAVHGNDCVNLTVFDESGGIQGHSSMCLPDGDDKGYKWDWPARN